MADTAKKGTAEVYYVENTVRKVGTRFHRALSATRHRFKLFVAGQRLIRGQKIPLTAAQFQQEEKKIHEMVLAGKVALYLPDGMRITSTHTGDLIYTKPNGASKIVKKDELPPRGEAKKVVAKDAPPAPVEVEPAPEVPTEAVPLVEEEPSAKLEPQDLTVLPGIGAGRAKKLEANAIHYYHQVVEMGVAGLVDLLGVTEEVAEEIIDKATELS